MGRRRSEYLCERCGKKGFRRNNPVAVVHYDHSTGRRTTCYIKKLVDAKDRNKDNFSAEEPPRRVWGESEFYHKLRSTAAHFHKIGDDLEKVSMQVYKFKPDSRLSTQCANNLDIFEKKFLNPVEKLLIPYHDQRYSTDYSTWFSIQIDNFKYGPRAAGKRNAVPTGQVVMSVIRDQQGKIDMDERGVIIHNVVREFTSSQVKKNLVKTLEFAKELLDLHQFGGDLSNWNKI